MGSAPSSGSSTPAAMKLALPLFLAIVCCLVNDGGGTGIYDLPEAQQIEKLKPLLLKLLQPKPRPVYQIQQIMKISVKEYCDNGLECCSSSLCCQYQVGSCCDQSSD